MSFEQLNNLKIVMVFLIVSHEVYNTKMCAESLAK